MNTLSGKDLSKIGIGSYGLGGLGHRDMVLTDHQKDVIFIDAVASALRYGMNFTEIAMGYGKGASMLLFREGLDKSGLDRHDIFLTHSLYPRDLPSLNVIHDDITDFHRVMRTEYADSTLVTQSLIKQFGAGQIYPLLHSLLKAKKTRYVSLSNASPDGIRAFYKEFGEAFVAHEGHLSFEIRALQDKSVFALCDELGVQNIIWRPLRRNKTLQNDWPLLIELATKYYKTQSQIILNWICHLGYRPMVMSTSAKHINENDAATDFVMESEDYRRMTEFRPEGYQPPQVDWEKDGKGDSIVSLVSDFELHMQ